MPTYKCPECRGKGIVTVEYQKDGKTVKRGQDCEMCKGKGTLVKPPT